jgi:4-carboxymuconolactone decarboxylase
MADSMLPNTFRQFVSRFPEIVDCHENMAKAVDETGPLDAKTCALIKIGICTGAGMESALRSHVRRATQAGATEAEIEQAILQSMNTCGFPRTVAAWSWAQIQFERDRADGEG